tara:strand:- start:1242 stop:2201 length:960 start_codon:yes stop_codon:yes gene_type:complete
LNLKLLSEKIETTLYGDPAFETFSLKSLSEAGESDLSLVLEDKFIKLALSSKAKAFITHKKIEGLSNQLVAKNSRKSLALAIQFFYAEKLSLNFSIQSLKPIADSARVSKLAKIGHFVSVGIDSFVDENTVLMNNVFVGDNCKIGKNCVIYPNVTILAGSIIGDNCIIHSGTVIGSDGFSYAQDNNLYLKVPHIGIVEIGDQVEIGSNVAIDRACLDKTIIKSGSKIDNLVHIAHNCDIGSNTAIAAQTGMTGGTKIGDNVMIAGHVAIDNSEIGNNVIILGKSGVTKDISHNSMVSGFPARDHKIELKEKARLKKLLK